MDVIYNEDEARRKNILERLDARRNMIVSFEGWNDRLILDSRNEILALRADNRRLVAALDAARGELLGDKR